MAEERNCCLVKDKITEIEFILDDLFRELTNKHFENKEQSKKTLEIINEIYRKSKLLFYSLEPPIEELYLKKLKEL